MACTELRVDTNNLNTTTTYKNLAETQVDTTNTKLQFAWTEAAVLSALHNRLVRFRDYNYATAALGTEVAIDDTSTGSAEDCDAISMVRLDSGVLVVAYGLQGAQAKESSDGGATWSATRSAVDGTKGVSTRAMRTLGTDGTTVWCISQETAGGAGGRYLYATKRTGVDTWDTAGRKTLWSQGAVSTPPYWLPDSGAQTAPRMLAIKAGTTALTQCFVATFVDTGAVYRVSCLWTVDGWATVNQTHISNSTVAEDKQPKLRVGADGRLRCEWVEDNGSGSYLPKIAYSDTFGQTWTVLGTPSPMAAGQGWGVGGNRGFALSSASGWIISVMDSENEVAPYKHRIFTGGDSTAGWAEADCDLSFTAWYSNSGEANVCGSKYIRAYGGIDSGSTSKTVAILISAVSSTPGGAPPLATESPAGSDQPNIYLTLDIADQRGFSGHETQVVCFFAWPEGDYTTERRKPEVMALVSSMDMNIQNPAVLPAIWKLDDPERWGKEAFVVNEAGTYDSAEDPFNLRWWSAELSLGETGSTNLVRGVYLKYRRQGETNFDVKVWIDGIIADTQSVPPSYPKPDEFWWPIPRDANAGSVVQLRVEDRIPADLVIEEFAIKFRPKHWRMRG